MTPSPSPTNDTIADTTGGNVCFHACHRQGKKQCKDCKSLHLSPLGVKTDPADPGNPDIT